MVLFAKSCENDGMRSFACSAIAVPTYRNPEENDNEALSGTVFVKIFVKKRASWGAAMPESDSTAALHL